MPIHSIRCLVFALLVGVLVGNASAGPEANEKSTGSTAEGSPEAEVTREFTGTSEARSYEDALADALHQMDAAVAALETAPCVHVKWRVIEVSGESGTPAGLHLLKVTVSARFESASADPAGTWTVSRSSVGQEMAGFTLTLKRDGDALSGSIVWSNGETSEIGAGEFKDGVISFRATPGSVTHQYSGTLSDDRIAGKWAAGIGVFDWRAERVPEELAEQ